jgi:hypothetical protein
VPVENPAARPATIESFAAQLEAIPIEEPWTTQRARDWWERHAAGQL